MRISDWSSDVCSSDLLDVDEPYTLVDAPQMAQIVVFVELVAHRVPGAMRRKRARAVGALELRRPVAAADLVVTDPNAAGGARLGPGFAGRHRAVGDGPAAGRVGGVQAVPGPWVFDFGKLGRATWRERVC